MKNLILLILTTEVMQGSYIEDHASYSLIDREKDSYMNLIESAYEKKEFTKKTLQNALKEDEDSQLGAIVRVIAYDEYEDSANIEENILNLDEKIEIYKKSLEITLAYCDVLMRVGEFKKVVLILDEIDLFEVSRKNKHKILYYIGLSKYLAAPNNNFSREFILIKYKFSQTQNIYTTRKEKN